MTVAVLGAGSWGTALALLLARNGHEVALLGRDAAEMANLRALRENLRYLPGFALPQNARPAALDAAPEAADLWVIATPAGAVREVVRFIPETALAVVASKGLDPVAARPLSETIREALPAATIAALSGPNLAVELARGVPAAAVAACPDEAAAETVRQAFMCAALRVYLSDDLTGVELAGALKNVLAIGGGVSDGLGYGDNTKGALLARGLREMTGLGVALGGKPGTFFGVAGVGDLFATAASRLSRNYRVGRALGEGRDLAEALAEIGQVAEGVPTAEAAVRLARRAGVEAPIFEAVDAILRGRLLPREGVARLMERTPKREGVFLGPSDAGGA
jgi:glycerol-3-phosphate dehydrogenase (NAD(P)+)